MLAHMRGISSFSTHLSFRPPVTCRSMAALSLLPRKAEICGQ
jgi:hypothetical protein